MGNNTWIDENGQIHREHSNQPEIKSMMKLYPELRLVPTSLVRRSGLVWWWILYIFVLLALMFSWVVLIFSIIDVDWLIGLWIPLLVISVILCVWWAISIYKKILRPPLDSRGGYKKLVKEADYISGERGLRGLCIFVKDERFGVIKLWDCTVFVPPVYDYMEWETPDKLLRVMKDGRTFLIDIYNNEV